MNLCCPSHKTTIKKEQPSDGFISEYSLFEILQSERVGLRFKLPSNNEQMLLIDIVLVKQQSMFWPQLFHKQPLNYMFFTS